MMSTPIGRLRVVAFLEGTSYLLLLGVAMPLKYLADLPIAVRVVGAAHGVLFVALCLTLLHAMIAARLPFGRAVIVFLSSLVPFGTYLVDPSLRREEDARRAAVRQP
jgi:integral membrane protein